MRVFFFNDTATTKIYTLPLHDALPISRNRLKQPFWALPPRADERPAFTFTPFDGGDDYRLFTLGASPGASLTEIEEQALLFPTYSHASK